MLALLWSNVQNLEQLWAKIRSNQCYLVRWYGKPCPRGPIELTGQQSAAPTSCPWTCMRGRPPPRGPACSSPRHGYPVCKRSGAGCSPRYPHSSATPSHCYAEVRHIINTFMSSCIIMHSDANAKDLLQQTCSVKGTYYITSPMATVIHIHTHPHAQRVTLYK